MSWRGSLWAKRQLPLLQPCRELGLPHFNLGPALNVQCLITELCFCGKKPGGKAERGLYCFNEQWRVIGLCLLIILI